MTDIVKGFVPQNTKKSTAWANRVFEDWVVERNLSNKDTKCPVDLLLAPDQNE